MMQDTEQTPLLDDQHGQHDQEQHLQHEQRKRKRTVLIAGFFMLFTLELGAGQLSPAFMAILEAIVCRKHYSDVRAGSDDRCDAIPIQTEVASIVGWILTFKLIPTILLSVPFGLMADTWGRKPTLFFSLLGMVLGLLWQTTVLYFGDSMDLRWVWATGAFAIIGGGNAVMTATIFAIVNDVSTPENRTTIFLYLGTGDVLANLLSSPLAYVTMRVGPWFCMTVGIALVLTALFAVMLVPETKPVGVKSSPSGLGETEGELTPDSWREALARGCRELGAVLRHQFFGNLLLGTTLFTVVFTSLGKTVSGILMQYAAKRFHWKWEEANLLNGLILVVTIILTTLVLPTLDGWLKKRAGMTLLKKDLTLVRLSFLFLFLGALAVGFSQTRGLLTASLVIYGLGSANELSMRALIAQAAGDRAATIFTTMTAMEMLGMAAAGPTMAALLSKGMEWGGVWRALPFFVASLIFFVATLIYSLMPFNLADRTTTSVGADGEEDNE